MVTAQYRYQEFGSLKREVLSSTAMSAECALRQIASCLRDANNDIHIEDTDDGYDIIISISLCEDFVYHIPHKN